MEKTYEVGFLVTPLLPEEKAVELVEAKLKGFITKAGGEVKSDNAPKMIQLAYPVKKVVEHKGSVFNEAYFGAIRFELPSESVAPFEAELKKIPELIRTLVISLPKDYNKPVVERRSPTAKSAPTEEDKTAAAGSAMTAEAIDKEIEGLLTPTK